MSNPSSFNPNDVRYKTCCCHSKTYTIVCGILEIFLICFVLVAVLPDVNSRICDNSSNNSTKKTFIDHRTSNNTNDAEDTEENMEYRNSSDEYLKTMNKLRGCLCDYNVIWLTWAILQIAAVNIMFYGIKNIRWRFFIPHVFFRVLTVLFILFIITIMIYCLVNSPGWKPSLIVGLVFSSIGTIVIIYATYAEFRCLHFIKRSQETGFSLSVARPIGPATISNSEREGPVRELPPLRHTYGARDQVAEKYTS